VGAEGGNGRLKDENDEGQAGIFTALLYPLTRCP